MHDHRTQIVTLNFLLKMKELKDEKNNYLAAESQRKEPERTPYVSVTYSESRQSLAVRVKRCEVMQVMQLVDSHKQVDGLLATI